jgi:uncharacterized protein (TIGR02271 family)
MAMAQEVLNWRGMKLVDRNGDKIGSIEEIYEDTDTGQAEWALVNTGLFGTKSTFVPIRDASTQGDEVSIPFEKSQVKDAPGIEREGELSRDEEQRLYSHYDVDYGTARSDSGLPQGGAATRDTDVRGTVGHDVSGPTTDDAMTRSEEELRVGKESRETGRARLRKYVVSDQVEQTVPVEREEIRVEREPITDANRDSALSGPAISEEEHEVVLHEERPVVQKDVVPKERVRLDKDTVTQEQRVSEEVRKEQIDVDGAEARRGGVTDRDPTRGDIDPKPTGDTGGTARGGLTGDRTTMDDQESESPGQRDRARLGQDPSKQAP